MVTIYTKDYCPYCKKAKDLLAQEGIEYKEINITDTPEKMQKISEQTAYMTVPQIFVDDEFLGGCDDLYVLHESGKLAEKIK